MTSDESRPVPVSGDEIRLGDFGRVIRRRWRAIASSCVGCVALVATISLILPKVYGATATIITPKEVAGTGFFGGLAAATGVLQQIPAMAAPSFTPNRDLFVGILKSRTLADSVVDHFNLKERYRVQYREDAVRRLHDAVAILVSREGIISVTVEDRNPRAAADIANYYVDQLDRIVTRVSTGEAGRQRWFLMSQLARAKADLGAAEESLRKFQEGNRAIVLQEQTRGAIEAAARLRGEIMAAQVQLQVMRNFATETNPEVVALKRRVDEMNRHLAQMQYGDRAGDQGALTDRRDFALPFSQVPGLGLELARLTRDVKVQETLVTLLTQQVEQAQIAEAKDVPMVLVLDRAVPAEHHTRPKVVLNTVVAAIASLLAVVVFALVVARRSDARRQG